MSIYNPPFDFEPPFANENYRNEISDTYQAITVNLTAEQVEFFQDILINYLSDNAGVMSDSEFCQLEDAFNVLKPGIISHSKTA